MNSEAEEIKEEDRDWISSAYVEDEEPDNVMSEDEKSFEEQDGFEEGDIEMENDEENSEAIQAISYTQNFIS